MSDKLNLDILNKLPDREKAAFRRGLEKLGFSDPVSRAELRAAFKRYKPSATDRELDIMVNGG